jgi:hypothetical protein
MLSVRAIDPKHLMKTLLEQSPGHLFATGTKQLGI